MALETGTFVGDLVSTNPPDTDPRSQGAGHLRLIKSVLENTFPNSSGSTSRMIMAVGVAGGTANALTLTPNPAVPALAANQFYLIVASATNTGPATLAVSGLGAVAILKTQSGGLVALVQGDLISGAAYLLLYDGTQFQLLNEAPYSQGANIASAATVNLDTATGDYVHITGTTTITALTLAQGEERTTVTDGILTLTNGASLILPTGANITTAAGDTQIWRGEASGVVRCIAYQPANGQPLYGQPQVANCQLVINSTTQIQLNRKKGFYLTINGVPRVIPASGPTLSNGGTLANTLYYIYAFLSAGVLTLEASTTTHATDAASGVEIKSGDATRTLVGVAYMDAANHFVAGLTRSYFNDPGVALTSASGSLTTTSSSAQVITNTSQSFFTWTGEVIQAFAFVNNVSIYPSAIALMSLGIDGVTATAEGVSFDNTGSGQISITVPYFGSLTEGQHTVQVLLRSQNAGQSAIVNAAVSTIRLQKMP